MTAKEYLEKELDFEDGWFVEEVYPSQIIQWMEDYHKSKLNDLSLQNVSYPVAQQYAEFCIRCDREKLPLIKIEDYLKQL